MKKILKPFVILISLVLCINSYAQDDGTSMNPIIDHTQEIVKYVESEMNEEIVRIEMDILSTTAKTSFRTLQEGYTYGIIAYGDYRFKDIDVAIYRWNGSSWISVNKDTSTDAMAIVSVTPTSTSDYKIVITAYRFNEGYTAGHYGLIICHEKY